VGGIFHLGSGVDLRLEASGSRFGHSYTPSADMTFVADGGTDLLGNVFIGGAYTY
jgi:hypothetical protein